MGTARGSSDLEERATEECVCQQAGRRREQRGAGEGDPREIDGRTAASAQRAMGEGAELELEEAPAMGNTRGWGELGEEDRGTQENWTPSKNTAGRSSAGRHGASSGKLHSGVRGAGRRSARRGRCARLASAGSMARARPSSEFHGSGMVEGAGNRLGAVMSRGLGERRLRIGMEKMSDSCEPVG